LQALEDLKCRCSKEYIAQLEQEAETHPAWKRNSQYLSFSWHELPDFLNVTVPNGDWIQNTVGCKTPHCAETVGIYGRKYPQLVPTDVWGKIPSSWKTLNEYFWRLCDLGMLEFSGDDWKFPGSCWFKVVNRDLGYNSNPAQMVNLESGTAKGIKQGWPGS